MGALSELIAKTDLIAKTFSPEHEFEERPDVRLLKVHEHLGELLENQRGLSHLPDSSDFDALALKRKVTRETAEALCDLLLFAKYNDIDLESAVEEKWFRQLSNRHG